MRRNIFVGILTVLVVASLILAIAIPVMGAVSDRRKAVYSLRNYDVYPIRQLEWSAGKAIYKGYHESVSASDADTEWRIIKYTYSGDDMVKGQMLVGSWTGRDGLGW